MSSNELLLKQEELNAKISLAQSCYGADTMLQALLAYREEIEEEIETRIASGKINEMTYFEVDDFLRKKNEITLAYEELQEDAKSRWIAEELTDSQLKEELNKLKLNYERELNELNKTI